MAHEDFNKFMSAKLEYTREALLKQVSPEYYSIIDVFMKSNANIVAEHRKKWNHKIYLEKGKKTPYVCNYKPLMDQESAATKSILTSTLAKSLSDLAY